MQRAPGLLNPQLVSQPSFWFSSRIPRSPANLQFPPAGSAPPHHLHLPPAGSLLTGLHWITADSHSLRRLFPLVFDSIDAFILLRQFFF